MAGLVPAIHALLGGAKNVDARDKPEHDGYLVGRSPDRDAYDSESTLPSLSAPEMIVTGTGNVPSSCASSETSGPGPSAPGLAASTSMAMSGSSSITASSCSI